MYFHIITSTDCNSQCRYCYKKSSEDFGNDLNEKFKFNFLIPSKIIYKTGDLKKFIESSDNTLTFYGGEPLIEIEKIKEIMDNIKARYMLQTNGLLLNKLDKKYINQFKTILISIDGDEKLTDFNRGKGTYKKVIQNINLIKSNGFKNELIARMVVDENSSLLKDIKHLFKIGFSSVHWQLDAGFYKYDFEKRNFSKFVKEYNKEVKKLADFWINNMKKGKVLKIYPFLGIFETLYYNKKEKLRCGSGYANYTISTDGNISVCPIMHDITNFYVGDIYNAKKLKTIFVEEPCTSCNILNICGGRCLYANKAKLWPKQGQKLICNTIENLIETIKDKLPEIKLLIKQNIISEKDFYYEKYNGSEIIP